VRVLTCMPYVHGMSDETTPLPLGPDADEITTWITTTWPETVVGEALSARFFSLTPENWPNFATLVTTDEHDMGNPSDLAREGVFRLNIGVGRETFERRVGSMVDPDYAALDTVLPHPVYAKQRWIAILNPSGETFDTVVKPLLVEAHDRLAPPRQPSSP
jgi:hypothetical protein